MDIVNGFNLEIVNIDGEPRDDSLCLSLTLKGGMAANDFSILGMNNLLSVNRAAAFVYKCFLEQNWIGDPDVAVRIGKNGICLTVEGSAGTIIQKAEEIITDIFFSGGLCKEKYECAKVNAIDRYSRLYSNPNGRALFYLMDYVNAKKDWTYKKFAKDLNEITFVEVKQFEELLINPRNSFFILSGEITKAVVEDLIEMFMSFDVSRNAQRVEMAYYEDTIGKYPISNVKDQNSLDATIISFDFNAVFTNSAEKVVWMTLLNYILFDSEGYIFSDEAENVIAVMKMVSYESVEEKIHSIDNYTDSVIEGINQSLYAHIASLMSDLPYFNFFLSEQIIAGMDAALFVEYIAGLDNCKTMELIEKHPFSWRYSTINGGD